MTDQKGQERCAVPSIAQLLGRYLTQRSTEADEPEIGPLGGEVELYQASELLAVSPQVALIDAWEAAVRLAGREPGLGLQVRQFRPPGEWSRLVHRAEPRCLVPCCVGVFPQLVRDPAPLLTADVEQWTKPAFSCCEMPDVEEWGRERLGDGRLAEALFAVGMLRLAGQFDASQTLLSAIERRGPAAWAGLLANEQAALCWFRGDLAQAEHIWTHHPQADSGVVLLNRGLTALCHRSKRAVNLLDRAAAAWPEGHAWHHLARMYQVLAETV